MNESFVNCPNRKRKKHNENSETASCLRHNLEFERLTVFAAAAPQKVVITPASFSEREGMLIVAQNQGFFRKHNFDVQLVLMPSAPLALVALTAGDSQFYFGTTSGASLGAVLNGLDGVFVAGFINKLVGAFAVGQDIKTPNDLKGKSIGVASLGGGNWMFTMLAFDHWGIDPKRDNITFRIIGDTGVRAAVDRQRPHRRLDAGLYLRHEFPARWLSDPRRCSRSEYSVSGQRAVHTQELPQSAPGDRRKCPARAARRDRVYSGTGNKTAVLKSLAQWLRLPKTDDALPGYEFMRKMYTKRIYPNVDGIRNCIRVLSTTNEKFRGLKARIWSTTGSSESWKRRAPSKCRGSMP